MEINKATIDKSKVGELRKELRKRGYKQDGSKKDLEGRLNAILVLDESKANDESETENDDGVKDCFNCGSKSHVLETCPDRNKDPKRLIDDDYGDVSNKCTVPSCCGHSSCCVRSVNYLISEDKPTVRAYINGIELQALLDSGSDITIIKLAEYQRLGSPPLGLGVGLQGLGSIHFASLGCFDAVLQVEGTQYKIQTHVVSDDAMRYEMILGRDFFRQIKVVIEEGKVVEMVKLDDRVRDAEPSNTGVPREEHIGRNNLRTEGIQFDDILNQWRKAYAMLRIEFERNLAANRQMGHINRDMRYWMTPHSYNPQFNPWSPYRRTMWPAYNTREPHYAGMQSQRVNEEVHRAYYKREYKDPNAEIPKVKKETQDPQDKLTKVQGSSKESKQGSVGGKEGVGPCGEYVKIKEEPVVKMEITEEEVEVEGGGDFSSDKQKSVTAPVVKQEDYSLGVTVKKEVDEEEELAKLEAGNQNFTGKPKIARLYEVGDLVAIKRTRPGAKFQNKYLGPYQVTKVSGNERYAVRKVRNVEGPKRTSTMAEFMKPWIKGYDEVGISDDENEDLPMPYGELKAKEENDGPVSSRTRKRQGGRM